MFFACILLLIAILSGTLLSFLYDETSGLAARLCFGAATGLMLLAFVGFLLALLMGLTGISVAIAGLVMLAPFFLLAKARHRRQIVAEIKSAKRAASSALRRPNRRSAAYALFFVLVAVMLGLIFARGAYQTSDGIYTGVQNNLGDLPLHLQVISSFAQGHNFPPEDPTFSGMRFAYPFMVDFLAAMLITAGAPILSAMWLENMVLALALVGLITYWTVLLTRSRLAALLSPALVLFSGGLGWTLLFQEVRNSDDGLFPLLGHLTHDYTIMGDTIFRWGNSITTLFVPQRSILFGLPIAVGIFCLWWKQISGDRIPIPATQAATAGDKASAAAAQRKREISSAAGVGLKPMLAAGLCAGLLPLVHAHTFLVVMGVGACLALLFSRLWRSWLAFFAVALMAAAPQLLWLARTGGVKVSSYLAWQPGWDHGSYNPVWFWFANTGFFIPLLVLALTRRDSGLPKRLLAFYAPFSLCFIIPNLVRVAPWDWDNIKMLFTWYIASAPLVAVLLADWLKQTPARRWLAAGLLFSMLFSGGLDILRVLAGASELREFDATAVRLADRLATVTPPHALILHAPTYNSPVFLTGRRSLLGYPGWIWSRGLDYGGREADIKTIYSGGQNAEQLLRQYHIEYVLIGPEELASLPVNQQFWSNYRVALQGAGYRVYAMAGQEGRVVK